MTKDTRLFVLFLLVAMTPYVAMALPGLLLTPAGYYQLLGDAFLAGQVHLNVFPGGDSIVYQGRYYLYFGPVPTLPHMVWRGVTGQPLHQAVTLFLYCLGNVTWIWLILGLLSRVWGLDDSPRLKYLVLALFAFGGSQIYMIGKPSVYHEAIAAGAFFLLGATYFLARYFSEQGKTGRNLLAAGIFLALAIGSRVTLVPYAFVLIVAAPLTELRQSSSCYKQAMKRTVVMATPISVMVAILLTYNFARFGNFLEFGMRYQVFHNVLASYLVKSGRFASIEYLPANLWSYLVAMPRISERIPFIYPPTVPAEFQRGGWENSQSFSVFVSEPILIFMFVAGAWALGNVKRGTALGIWIFASLLASLGILFGDSLTLGVDRRYYYDFAPMWYMLAFVGLLVIKDFVNSDKVFEVGGLTGPRVFWMPFLLELSRHRVFRFVIAALLGLLIIWSGIMSLGLAVMSLAAYRENLAPIAVSLFPSIEKALPKYVSPTSVDASTGYDVEAHVWRFTAFDLIGETGLPDLGIPEMGPGRTTYRYAQAPRDKPGWLTMGPYQSLPPGVYEASFRLKAWYDLRTDTVAELEVSAMADKPPYLGERLVLRAGDFASPGEWQEFHVRFSLLTEVSTLEYKVYWPGKGILWFESVMVRRVGDIP